MIAVLIIKAVLPLMNITRKDTKIKCPATAGNVKGQRSSGHVVSVGST